MKYDKVVKREDSIAPPTRQKVAGMYVVLGEVLSQFIMKKFQSTTIQFQLLNI